ncbi:MAG: helix-turn-helix domain-containing protein [Tannerellaceae bacterium]|nr:helix-turn-helix domain-containing protein [Tannerellaceae bacterium]
MHKLFRKWGIVARGIIIINRIFFVFVKDEYLIELGNQIRTLRKEKGLSQEQLALKADVDRSYMGGIERGERNVTFLTLVKIANTLGCDVAKFTKGIPQPAS